MTHEGGQLDALQSEVDELGTLLDARLGEIERLTGSVGLGLRARLVKLERQLGGYSGSAPASRTAPLLGFLKAFTDYAVKIVSASTPVAVLLVGLFITDAVEQALEERKVEIQEGRLDLDATRAMEHLLERLRRPNIGEEEAKSTALLVAGYGLHAVLPLVMELDLESAKYARVAAARYALQNMALSYVQRRSLCTTLVGLLHFSAEGRFFEHQGLRHTVTLSGALRCPKATTALRDLPRDDPELVKAIDAALAALQR